MSGHFKKLAQGSGIMSLAGILRKGVSFLLLPLYTRYLTPADYGAVELFLVMLAILEIAVQQGMSSAVLKRIEYDHAGEDIAASRLAIGTGFVFVFGSALIVGALTILFAGQLAPIVFDRPGFEFLIALGALTLLCNSVATVLLVPLRVEQRYTTLASLAFLVFLAKLACNLIGLLVFDAGFASLIYGEVGGAVVHFGGALFCARRHVNISFDRAELRLLGKFGRPLIFSAIGLLALHSTDRILLKYYGTLVDVGLYSMAARLGLAVEGFLLAPFRSVWPTVYYKMAREEGAKPAFALFALRFLALGLAATLAAHSFAPYLLRLLTTPAFYGAASAVGLMVASAFLFTLNDILKVGMNIEGRTHLLPVRVGVAAVINVALGLVLIPRWGIVAAAGATVISYFLMNAVTIWACRSFYRVDYDWRKAGGLTALAGICLALLSVVPLELGAPRLAIEVGLLTAFVVLSARLTKLDLRSALSLFRG